MSSTCVVYLHKKGTPISTFEWKTYHWTAEDGTPQTTGQWEEDANGIPLLSLSTTPTRNLTSEGLLPYTANGITKDSNSPDVKPTGSVYQPLTKEMLNDIIKHYDDLEKQRKKEIKEAEEKAAALERALTFPDVSIGELKKALLDSEEGYEEYNDEFDGDSGNRVAKVIASEDRTKMMALLKEFYENAKDTLSYLENDPDSDDYDWFDDAKAIGDMWRLQVKAVLDEQEHYEGDKTVNDYDLFCYTD